MVERYKKLNKKGFTIIEVLIVLAIAGLIMLIVFLAVPALQRSSRNTSRKTDVASILGAVSEFVSNNNGGALPAGAGVGFNTVFPTAAVKTGFYVPANIIYTNNAAPTASAGPAAAANDVVWVQTNSKCNATGTAASATGASQRSFIALYRIETSTGDILQCQES